MNQEPPPRSAVGVLDYLVTGVRQPLVLRTTVTVLLVTVRQSAESVTHWLVLGPPMLPCTATKKSAVKWYLVLCFQLLPLSLLQ